MECCSSLCAYIGSNTKTGTCIQQKLSPHSLFLYPTPCTTNTSCASSVYGLMQCHFFSKNSPSIMHVYNQSFLSLTVRKSMDGSSMQRYSPAHIMVLYKISACTREKKSAHIHDVFVHVCMWVHQTVSEADRHIDVWIHLCINLRTSECVSVCQSVLSAWYGTAAYMI